MDLLHHVRNELCKQHPIFLKATDPVLIVLVIVYVLCGMVATVFLNRFPKYSHTFRRIGFSLVAYIFITVTGITLLFWGYDYFSYLNYEISIVNYALALSVLLTLLGTSLDAEMQFIQSYFHLLKTRYGETLQLETNIDTHRLQCQLLPLTLQMLVENAVKHNMMLKDSPLKIMIMTTNSGKQIVCNNLQRKVRNVSSNKAGLSNIISKYRLMNQEEIMVSDDGKEFLVVIPLLQARQTSAPIAN